ncbi:hypothetical protein N9L26_00460 [Candidatus Pacebacteria bacterium]|nr:hypothetical protein [Candidatus Paceibacterota bacterium]
MRLRQVGVPDGNACNRAIELDKRQPTAHEVEKYFANVSAGAPCDRALQNLVGSRIRRRLPV